jgi:hypothetical protein
MNDVDYGWIYGIYNEVKKLKYMTNRFSELKYYIISIINNYLF